MTEDVLEADFTPSSELAVREEAAIRPTVTPDEARAAMGEYQRVCEAVLSPEDYQEFTERGKRKRFKKKSAVKKLQTFWSLDVTVRDIVRDDLGDGHFGWRMVGIAKAPSGRVVESTGGCSTFEERFEVKRYDDEADFAYAARLKKANARAYHDVMTTAETRATNRAVMNCIGVGGGEVTADEISRPRTNMPSPPPTPPPVEKQVADRVTRAQALGVIPQGPVAQGSVDLRAYLMKLGLPYRQSVIDDHLAHLSAVPTPVVASAKKPSDKQKGFYFSLIGELNMDDEARYAFNRVTVDKESFSTFTADDAAKAIDELNRRLDQQNAGS